MNKSYCFMDNESFSCNLFFKVVLNIGPCDFRKGHKFVGHESCGHLNLFLI